MSEPALLTLLLALLGKKKTAGGVVGNLLFSTDIRPSACRTTYFLDPEFLPFLRFGVQQSLSMHDGFLHILLNSHLTQTHVHKGEQEKIANSVTLLFKSYLCQAKLNHKDCELLLKFKRYRWPCHPSTHSPSSNQHTSMSIIHICGHRC